MAPKRKTNSETSSLKTMQQERRFSQRVIGLTTNDTNKSIILTQQKKQLQSKRQHKKKNEEIENEFDFIEEGTSQENPKSMSIDSNNIDSDNQELSTSNYCLSTSAVGAQNKPLSRVQLGIGDDDDSNEFHAMFMSNAPLSKPRPNHSSTPLVRPELYKPYTRTTAEPVSPHQIRKPTRRPLSTISVDHQPTPTMSNITMQNVNTHINPRIGKSSSPATQLSVGSQSLSTINYTTNNSAILETFAEYRTLRRDLQREKQQNKTWKHDYQVLTRQMEKLQNNSFPRPNADGRVFLEQLLESLNSSEQIEDIRSSKELAVDIGIPEITLLSSSNVDPQKTALRVFNQLFPGHQDKQLLINVATLEVKYPNLLKNLLVWSKRCTPGCGYTMSMLKDAIGNSIRCARHKLKNEQARLAAVASGQQFEPNNSEDDMEIMPHD